MSLLHNRPLFRHTQPLPAGLVIITRRATDRGINLTPYGRVLLGSCFLEVLFWSVLQDCTENLLQTAHGFKGIAMDKSDYLRRRQDSAITPTIPKPRRVDGGFRNRG